MDAEHETLSTKAFLDNYREDIEWALEATVTIANLTKSVLSTNYTDCELRLVLTPVADTEPEGEEEEWGQAACLEKIESIMRRAANYGLLDGTLVPKNVCIGLLMNVKLEEPYEYTVQAEVDGTVTAIVPLTLEEAGRLGLGIKCAIEHQIALELNDLIRGAMRHAAVMGL